MIVKDKDPVSDSGLRAHAGDRQERDVAFYLRRAFGNNPEVLILHDLRLVWEGETAQIDHLLVHPLGFVLVESKSIYGEVRVNEQHEWARSYKGSWAGMSSPIQQLSLQQRLLRDLLYEHRQQLLGKVLGLQAGFGGREWYNVCAVSSSAILHREGMPPEISNCVIKSEFIGDHLAKLMNLSRGTARKMISGRPEFREGEIERVAQFLLSRHESRTSQQVTVPPEKKPRPAAKKEKQELKDTKKPQSKATPRTVCRHCDEKSNLSAASGRWGYFVKCGVCEKNTAMPNSCEVCGSSNGKVRKSGSSYAFNCAECGHVGVVFEQE